jgi:hypothetical protein
MQGKINIVHLNLINKSYYTGIDRYIEIYNKVALKQYSDVLQVHQVFLINNHDIVFSEIKDIDGALYVGSAVKLNIIYFVRFYTLKGSFYVFFLRNQS